MLNWLRPKPACPIDPADREWIDARWQWLEGEFGTQRLRQASMILPTAEFFPDPFHGTEEHARRELDRLCGYTSIDPAMVELSFFKDRNPFCIDEGNFWAAGLYDQQGRRFRVCLEEGQLDDPLATITTIAHELGHLLLLGQGRITEGTEDHEPLTDLLTVYLGLGVLMANSAVREFDNDVAGWSMYGVGYLGMQHFGYALARFAYSRGEDGSTWMKELRLDVRSAFKQSMRYLQADVVKTG